MKGLPLLALILLLYSCGTENSNRVNEPGRGEALICSLTGEVRSRKKQSDNWSALRGGEIIKNGQEIRVDEGEVYLCTSEGLYIYLSNNSELTFFASSRQNPLSLILDKGSLSLMNPGIDVRVEIPALSLYSREGTFTLKSSDERHEVYNHDGDLRLLPGIENLDRLKSVLDEKYLSLADDLPDSQQPVFPGETWFLDNEELRARGNLYDDLILRLKAEDFPRDILEEEIHAILSMDITISEYSRGYMERVLTGFDLFGSIAGEELYRMTIHSEEGTSLEAGYTITNDTLELVLPAGYGLPLSFRKSGFEPLDTVAAPVPVSQFSDIRNYKLPRLTSRKISVEIDPPQSEITINEIYAGNGNIVLELKPDEPLELKISLEGYNEQYLYLDASAECPDSIKIELKKTVEKVIKGAYQEIIGLYAQGEDLYVSDWNGIVWYVHEPSGWRRYNTRTNNYPNLISEPVVTNNYIYFSGKRSLVVINRLSGAALTITDLNERENHLKGQKAVPMDYQVLFPTKDSIRFLTGDGNKIRELFIPGGSLMTPAVYEGRIYTAAMDGQIYEISTSGQILRSLETGLESPTGGAIVFDSSRGYLCDSRGAVAAFSPASMTLEWESSPSEGRHNFNHSVLLTDERLYVYGGETLFAFDRNTGKSRPSIGAKILTYPLLLNGYIYAMTANETMTAFSANTGETVKSIALGYEVTSPVYSFEGRIMAGTFDGHVLIMNQLDPSLLSKPIK